MPRTVKVRIAVAVDAEGNWFALGGSGANEKAVGREALEEVGNDDCTGEALHWVTAEVPIPEPQEVAGTVEPAS